MCFGSLKHINMTFKGERISYRATKEVQTKDATNDRLTMY
jgi:hypothetical protein